MKERIYQVAMGSLILLLLFLQADLFMRITITIIMLEGLLNLPLPTLFGTRASSANSHANVTAVQRIIAHLREMSVHRLYRAIIGLLLILTYIVIPEQAWFFPWFMGFMLLLAGFSNFCPMAYALRWLGLR